MNFSLDSPNSSKDSALCLEQEFEVSAGLNHALLPSQLRDHWEALNLVNPKNQIIQDLKALQDGAIEGYKVENFENFMLFLQNSFKGLGKLPRWKDFFILFLPIFASVAIFYFEDLYIHECKDKNTMLTFSLSECLRCNSDSLIYPLNGAYHDRLDSMLASVVISSAILILYVLILNYQCRKKLIFLAYKTYCKSGLRKDRWLFWLLIAAIVLILGVALQVSFQKYMARAAEITCDETTVVIHYTNDGFFYTAVKPLAQVTLLYTPIISWMIKNGRKPYNYLISTKNLIVYNHGIHGQGVLNAMNEVCYEIRSSEFLKTDVILQKDIALMPLPTAVRRKISKHYSTELLMYRFHKNCYVKSLRTKFVRGTKTPLKLKGHM